MGAAMQVYLTRCLRAAALPLIAFTLGSCSSDKPRFAPACPVPGLVRPLAELARYRGGSQDIRDLVVRARIIDITGTCEPGDDNTTVVATAQLVVDVTRGPAMQGGGVSLPVFVAVTESGVILDKTLFDLPVEFVRNVDNARAASKEIRMEIPVTPQKSGAAYGIVGGFQLTPGEVAAWRRNNPK
jgi:hypothetical protein